MCANACQRSGDAQILSTIRKALWPPNLTRRETRVGGIALLVCGLLIAAIFAAQHEFPPARSQLKEATGTPVVHALGGHRRPARFDLSGIEFAYEGYGDRIGALNRALQRRQPIRVLYAPETDLLQFLSHSDLAIWEVRSASNDAIVSYAGIVEFRNNNTLLGLLLGGVFMAVGALVVLFDGRPRRA